MQVVRCGESGFLFRVVDPRGRVESEFRNLNASLSASSVPQCGHKGVPSAASAYLHPEKSGFLGGESDSGVTDAVRGYFRDFHEVDSVIAAFENGREVPGSIGPLIA